MEKNNCTDHPIKFYPKGASAFIPPPGFTPRSAENMEQLPPRSAENMEQLTPRASETIEEEVTSSPRLNGLFDFMISTQNIAEFKENISTLSRNELKRMAVSLTSESNDFTEIISNKYGSKHVQYLLGKSEEIQTIFHEAILRSFFQIMTDKYGRYVPVKAMNLFIREKKTELYQKTLDYAIDLARDEHGCVALSTVITDIEDLHYKNKLRSLITQNALLLSTDPWGNFVMQRVLALNDIRCRFSIAFHLRNHYVELSFLKYGSYVVEKLLEIEEEDLMTMFQVVDELILGCDGATLMRLARHEYGNFVVRKALMATLEVQRFDLFSSLYRKLVPFMHLLCISPWSRRIVAILESCRFLD